MACSCLWGEGNAKNGLVFPEKVDDIPVNRKFDTLYVYHATFYSSRDGSPVYHLTLQYANGTSSMTTICYGAHVRDWFQTPNEQVSELTDLKSKMVWRGDNPDSKADSPVKLRFFITSITNPRPVTRGQIDQSGLGERELCGLHPGDDHRAGRSAQSRRASRQVNPESPAGDLNEPGLHLRVRSPHRGAGRDMRFVRAS